MSATFDTIRTTGHVGLNVTDLDRSIAFYTRALGLELAQRSDQADQPWAFLTGGGRLVLTLWQQAERGFSTTTAGLHHLSFEVASVDAVRAAEDRLNNLEGEFVYDGVVAHAEGAESGGVYFTDPDGTRLEIYAPDGGNGAAAPSGAAPTCGFF